MRGMRYTDAEVKNYAALVRMCAAEAMADSNPLTTALAMDVRVFLPIPGSWSRKRQEAAAAGLILPTVRPDWENIGKAIGDGAESIVYIDDKIIVDGRVRKLYDLNPRVDVRAKIVATARDME